MELEPLFLESMAKLGASGGRHCLIALSGGGDSVALLELCAATVSATGNRYSAARVRHNIRSAETENTETVLCRRLCQDRNITFASLEGDMPASGGPEQAARIYRYDLLNRHADDIGADRLLLAHTRDDNRETLLMRFFSGAGPEGLKGIPPVRERIRRPLLELSGDELRGYLNSAGIRWCDDATNRENSYLRNNVRNRLVPLLQEIFPGWEKAADTLLLRSGEAASDLNAGMKASLAYRTEGPSAVWDRTDWDASGEYTKALALLACMNSFGGGDDRRIPWSMVAELRDGANRSENRNAGGFRIRCADSRITLDREPVSWSGRKVFHTVEEMSEGALLDREFVIRLDHREHTAEDEPGDGIGFPVEISWDAPEGRNTQFIVAGPERTVNVGAGGTPIKLTEKTSGRNMPDADKHIVYIHIEKV